MRQFFELSNPSMPVSRQGAREDLQWPGNGGMDRTDRVQSARLTNGRRKSRKPAHSGLATADLMIGVQRAISPFTSAARGC